MNQFVPCKGDFFYTKRRPYSVTIPDGVLAMKTVTQTDNSFRSEVLECIARDDHAVVTHTRVIGRVVLPRDMWEFFPVGPEVLAALGLTPGGEANHG